MDHPRIKLLANCSYRKKIKKKEDIKIPLFPNLSPAPPSRDKRSGNNEDSSGI